MLGACLFFFDTASIRSSAQSYNSTVDSRNPKMTKWPVVLFHEPWMSSFDMARVLGEHLRPCLLSEARLLAMLSILQNQLIGSLRKDQTVCVESHKWRGTWPDGSVSNNESISPTTLIESILCILITRDTVQIKVVRILDFLQIISFWYGTFLEVLRLTLAAVRFETRKATNMCYHLPFIY
jgi:hypothetical protein